MRTGLNILAPRREPVPFAAQRADQLRLAPFIDPAPQPLNVDLNQIGERVEGLFPDMFRDFGAGNYITCAPRQVFEQGVLFGGQFNQLSAAPDFVRTACLSAGRRPLSFRVGALARA